MCQAFQSNGAKLGQHELKCCSPRLASILPAASPPPACLLLPSFDRLLRAPQLVMKRGPRGEPRIRGRKRVAASR